MILKGSNFGKLQFHSGWRNLIWQNGTCHVWHMSLAHVFGTCLAHVIEHVHNDRVNGEKLPNSLKLSPSKNNQVDIG